MKTDYEKERETIFAGVEHGQHVGVGPLCEYVSKEGADKADQSSTFEVRQLFISVITLGSSQKGKMHFTRIF